MIDPNWLLAGGLWITSVGGWVYTAVRNGRNHARDMGKLEGTVSGLETRVGSLEKGIGDRMGSLEKGVGDVHGRIDNLITTLSGTRRRERD